jgi:hypothetical protein
MNSAYLQWNTGKCAFAFFTLNTCQLLFLQYKKLNSRGLKIYLSALALGSVYLLILLLGNHWF